jgi:hypothetical protein
LSTAWTSARSNSVTTQAAAQVLNGRLTPPHSLPAGAVRA